MSDQAVKSEAGVLETLKENLNPSHLMKKFNITSATLLQMAIYFGVGIMIGYMLKKYGKFVIVLILFILGLLLVQQIGLVDITVHTDKVQELFGLQPTAYDDKHLLVGYWEWVKAHVALVLSLSIGFLVGLRIGG